MFRTIRENQTGRTTLEKHKIRLTAIKITRAAKAIR